MADYAHKHQAAVIARKLADPVPPINSGRRDWWIRIIRTMDQARFGESREVVTWKHSKADLRGIVKRRVAAGERFPSRDEWEAIAKATT